VLVDNGNKGLPDEVFDLECLQAVQGKRRPGPGPNGCPAQKEPARPTCGRLRTFELKWRSGKVEEIHCEYITGILSLLASQGRLWELDEWREK
jgi:hypothetical protein